MTAAFDILAEAEWPEAIVRDSTRFMYTDRWTNSTHQLFCILGVWGYPAGASEGRMWFLGAGPDQGAAAWAKVFASLPGRPASIVCDRDYGTIGGAQAHWGKGRSVSRAVELGVATSG